MTIRLGLVLLSLFGAGQALADVGKPPILAVARVTLADGSRIEGFWMMRSGGYGADHYHGFYWLGPDGEPHLERITFESSRFPVDARALSARRSFAENTRKFDERTELEIGNGAADRILVARKVAIAEYRLRDHLVLHADLPLNPWTLTPDREGGRRIPVAEIQRFELVTQPSPGWLEKIARHRAALMEAINDPAGSGDMAPPEWFHEALAVRRRIP